MARTWTAASMVSAVRRIIDDSSYETVWEIKEDVGASTGVAEYYYPLETPVVSGCSVRLRGGSRFYTLVDFDATPAGKQFRFDYTEGLAIVSGGTTTVVPEDTRVYLSYAWEAEKDQLYSADQVWLYMIDAATDIKPKAHHTIDLSGSTLATAAMSSTPTETQGWLFVLQTSLNLLETDQRRFVRSALVIRHDDLSYDNSRGATVRIDTIAALRSKLEKLVESFLMGSMTGSKIDVYSTKDFGTSLIGEYQEDEVW